MQLFRTFGAEIREPVSRSCNRSGRYSARVLTVEEDFYTPSEAARVLGITKRQVTNLLNAGELEGRQEASGRWHVPKAAVHDLLEDRRSRGRHPPRSTAHRSSGAPVSPTEDRERVEALQRELGRLEGRLE